MKTPKEIREAQATLESHSNLLFELKNHDGYKLLREKIDSRVDEAKNQILASNTFEEFKYRKGFFDGISLLIREVDAIISRGKKLTS